MEDFDGIVVHPEIAKATPCRCYKTDETEICFSPGIIGTLSKAQKEIYCPTKEYVTEGKIPERIAKFKESVEICKKKIEVLPKGQRLPAWLSCMGEEARKRGIELSRVI